MKSLLALISLVAQPYEAHSGRDDVIRRGLRTLLPKLAHCLYALFQSEHTYM